MAAPHDQEHNQPGSPDVPEDLVYQFSKNGKEHVYAALSTWKGHRLASVRVHVPDGEGGWTPTRKGLTLSVSHLPELLAAVQALVAAVDGQHMGDQE